MEIQKRQVPSLDDLIARKIPNPEKIFEIQEIAQRIFSIGLEDHKGTLWLGNTYGIKPNVFLDGLKSYEEAAMKLGLSVLSFTMGDISTRIQEHFAELIGCTNPKRIALGINATTFISQILSNYWGKSFKVLTSNLEFYGVAKVLNRLKEIEGVQVDMLDAASDFLTFSERIKEACEKNRYDVVIMSDVFFKSGNILDNVAEIFQELKPKIGKIVIDGSSTFGNVPVTEIWGSFINEIYYIGAPKKFLGCGEGLAFMSVPNGCEDRPVFTGWLIKDYHDESQFYNFPVQFPKNSGDIYCNSTQDFSVRFRALAILDHFKKMGFTFEKQYFYNSTLQGFFLKKLDEEEIIFMGRHNLINQMGKYYPLQTCFNLEDMEVSAKEICLKLKTRNIHLTYRGNVLRVCMAVYFTIFDIEWVVNEISQLNQEIKKK
jgi:selenocysteine lyase/cysteine desulfurase